MHVLANRVLEVEEQQYGATGRRDYIDLAAGRDMVVWIDTWRVVVARLLCRELEYHCCGRLQLGTDRQRCDLSCRGMISGCGA